ncbi:MAG: hypothetical protein D6760_09505 [Deltaproteobacteria bacterium]|nr:MAG: hypothetical protein D6760_09505 [Deltaproteobacteria bacterium]
MGAAVRVFIGPLLRVHDRARRYIEEHLSGDARTADLQIVRLPEESLTEALDSLAQVGMFSSGRALWLRGLGSEPAEQTSALLEFLDSPSADECLIVASTTKLDQRGRLWKWLVQHDAVEDLRIGRDKRGGLDRGDLAALAHERAAAAGVKLGREAVDRIIELAGLDPEAVILEIDKVCLAVQPGQRVTADLVDRVMRNQQQAMLYHLTDAIGRRSLADAQKLVDRLLDAGEHPLRILVALSNYVGLLIEATPVASGLPPAALANAGAFARNYFPKLPEHVRAGFKSPFRAYHVFAAAARFRPDELRAIHSRLVSADLSIKASGPDPRLLLAGVVAVACAGNP